MVEFAALALSSCLLTLSETPSIRQYILIFKRATAKMFDFSANSKEQVDGLCQQTLIRLVSELTGSVCALARLC